MILSVAILRPSPPISSTVGEKTILTQPGAVGKATPITTVELLTAKIVAAVVPAILATWLAFAIFLVGARLLAPGDGVQRLLSSTGYWRFCCRPPTTLATCGVGGHTAR
ncbi:MAG: hypothetical protein IPH95_11935 [Candidatus Promineofilum sp.]|nr:hypothetical protein [Promineifilum sp.]